MATLREHRDEILAIIDRGEWKHSWHLPSREHGGIDWSSDETRRRVIELLAQARDRGLNLAWRSQQLIDAIAEDT